MEFYLKNPRLIVFFLFFPLLAYSVAAQMQVVPTLPPSTNPKAAKPNEVRAQKPPLDPSVFSKWPSVQSPGISNDGNYVRYIIRNIRTQDSGTLVLQATNANWKLEIPGAGKCDFTQDSRIA